jgi:release factor glutamine methyltransferase
MKLREWLVRGEAELSTGPHPDRSRRDAEMLLLHQIGKNKAWLMAHADDDFSGCGAIGYAAQLERRRRGEPIQYIVGECEFYGMPFRVTPDVLIPRPETEHLVEKAIGLAEGGFVVPHPNRTRRGLDGAPSILDVGTGSGAIAIALAANMAQAAITAIDISSAALKIARQNAAANAVADQIRFLEGDLLAPVAGEQFEIIVSNPPYVPNTDRALIAVEVREHEPAVALFAGEDGLEIYRRLIPAAFAALVPGGFLLLEIGFTQAHAIEGLLRSVGFASVEFIADLQDIPRVASAMRP